MVKKVIVEETTDPTIEESAPVTDAATVKTEDPFTPQLMVANVAPVTVTAPKLIKVQVNIGTVAFEKGEFRFGTILDVSEDEYRRIKDYVKIVS
jgi:hypothetical protein